MCIRDRSFGLSNLNNRCVDDTKVTDHHALIITGIAHEGLSEAESTVYTLSLIHIFFRLEWRVVFIVHVHIPAFFDLTFILIHAQKQGQEQAGRKSKGASIA